MKLIREDTISCLETTDETLLLCKLNQVMWPLTIYEMSLVRPMGYGSASSKLSRLSYLQCPTINCQLKPVVWKRPYMSTLFIWKQDWRLFVDLDQWLCFPAKIGATNFRLDRVLWSCSGSSTTKQTQHNLAFFETAGWTKSKAASTTSCKWLS